ncbi:MAG TPA: ribulose-phosphate 3-epimerase [Candidatus Thalassarchaeaceae archaeon]|nr:ribulose-phosphate 3-epimerase [Candidatus Thalassarchaeaceae archaeon]|tara:strand:- start:569 stop:1252 length:684 start_codon:yes stop_codon:yes gene_type:complete
MEITPSILTADFTILGEVLDDALEADIRWIHLDVMDGNWVVNRTITFGPALIRSIRNRLGDDVVLDCHLMITNAEETWSQYVDAGVNLVIAHIEAVQDPAALIDSLHAAGVEAGLVLNPDTPVDMVLPYLPNLDLVLVMSVVPGKGGQSFMPEVEEKVRCFRKAIDQQISGGGRQTRLMIDGGIKAHNAAQVADWGVDIAVVGSGLINDKGSIAENLAEIHAELDQS